MHANIGAISRH